MSDRSRKSQTRASTGLRQKGTSTAKQAGPAKQTGPTGARHCLHSLTFFFAGSLSLLNHAEATMLVEKHGGRVNAAPTKTTDFVVVGAKLTSKTREIVEQLKLKPINQDKLFDLIRRLPSRGALTDEERAERAVAIIGASHDPLSEDDDDVEEIEDDDVDVNQSNDLVAESDSSMFKNNKRKLGSTSALASQAPRKLFKQSPGPTIHTQQDPRAWTERYKPRSVDELGVNKNKIKGVEDFLVSAFSVPSSPKALILKGPPGSGKSTVVDLLAAKLDMGLKHWTNPPGNTFATSSEYTSFASHFDDFVGTAGKFGVLETSADFTGDLDLQATKKENKRQLLVIEEFPSLSADSSVRAFRSVVSGYIASISRRLSVTPLILIISESVVSNSSNSADKFTAHRLLGPDIINMPSLRTIDFNEVAPTFLTKALKLISDRRARDTRKPAFASQRVIKKLATLKDLRQAVATLEFLETQVKQPAVTLVGSAKSSLDLAKEAERGMLDMIEERHGNLGLFHAVGKVIYNKRSEQTLEKSASEVDVDVLYTTTGTDTSTFISALHENYTLSCCSLTNSKESEIDALISSTESLCDADLLSAWSAATSRNTTAGEELRQDEIAFDVCVRGLLNALPYPVKRRAPTFTGSLAGHRYDPHRMYYPKDLKLWRQKEEISSILDSLNVQALNGTLDAELQQILPRRDATAASSSAISQGSAAKMELLLDRLPYVSKILLGQQSHTSNIQKNIERAIRFRGKGIFATDDDSDEELDAEERHTFAVNVKKQRKGKPEDDLGVQSLVLSDDDIEDDESEDHVSTLLSSTSSTHPQPALPRHVLPKHLLSRHTLPQHVLPQHIRSADSLKD